MKRPDVYFSWAWTPYQVAQQERQSSPLILPDAPVSGSGDAALVHFASFDAIGQERNWLWLFHSEAEAMALRCLPQFAQGKEIDLIETTIPPDQPGQPQQIYLQCVPRSWLLNLPLAESGISEVWLGFDYKKYAWDRLLEVSCDRLSVDEFLSMLRQST